MRKLDSARHENKRQEILAAARRCFERSGLKRTSIADICKEAGISPGHLYHYFRSKDEILATLSEGWLDAVGQRFEQLLSREGDLVAPLVEEVGRLAPEGSSAGAELVFEMLAESTRTPEIAAVLRAHSHRLRTLLGDVLREGQCRGSVNPDLDPEAVATIIIVMIDGIKALALREPDMNRRSAVEMMQRVLFTLIAQGSPERRA